MPNRHILNLVVNSHTNTAISGTPAPEARFPYSLTIRTSFYDVPTSQFTHFVHELASSTSQSLLGAQPPNPCPRTFTNVLYTNVYLVFFFFLSRFKVHLNILLPVSFKISPTSLNFNNNSVSYPQNNISSTLLLQALSNSDQLTLIFIVDPSSKLSTDMGTAQLPL